MLAARNDHADTVKLLLEKEANTQLLDYGGRTALTNAVFAGKNATAELLIADKNYDLDNDSIPALTMAISMDRIQITKKIIERGTNLNAIIGSLPLLSWAIKNKHYSAAELLIKSGADINKADTGNMIPLDYALDAKNEKIIKMLHSVKTATTEK